MKHLIAFFVATGLRILSFFILLVAFGVVLHHDQPISDFVLILLAGAALFWTSANSIEKEI